MKLPSAEQIVREARHTLRRFPFVLAIAAAGTIAAISTVEFDAVPDATTAFRVLFAALLGIPFSVGLKLYAEKRRLAAMPSLLLRGAGVVLLLAYAWSLPEHIPSAPAIHVVRLLLLLVGLHLFASVSPWLGRGEVNGFWQFNKAMFLRLLTAGLFTIVLYAGLAIALAAVENLFELHVPGERYMQLWILLLGMFMTWFFLAGVPEDLDALDAEDEYPKGLKIFAQYVLIPLVAVYLIILFTYSGKIIVEWTWPFGWVSRLILGFASVGMFSFLLLHPIRGRSGNGWILTASRFFYIALAPLLVMYFLAVFRRLSDYGITESRYLAIVMGIWLSAMTLYFMFSRQRNIKIIPLTLLVLAFVVSVGPWGAFAISEDSQVQRLEALLSENGLLRDGRVREAEGDIPARAAREVSAVLQYLHEMHGYGAIEEWFAAASLRDSAGTHGEWMAPSTVAGLLGVEYVSRRQSSPGGDRIFDALRNDALLVTGYDHVLPEQFFNAGVGDREFVSGPATVHMNPGLDTVTLIVAPPGETADTLLLPLAPLRDRLLKKYDGMGAGDIPKEMAMAEAEGPRLRMKVYVYYLLLRKEKDEWSTRTLRLQVLYGKVPVEHDETGDAEE